MSAPIIASSYSIVLNEANNFTYTQILRPAIINKNYVRVLSSNSNTIFAISCIRDSYIAKAESTQLSSQTGLCFASEDTWWSLNTPRVDKITFSIFEFSSPQPSSIDITLQFEQFQTEQ